MSGANHGKAAKDDHEDNNLRIGGKGSTDLKWLSALEAPLRVTGLPWLERDGVYRRLPVNPSHAIRPEVDRLANYTTGVQVRFRTDSPKLYVRVKLAAPYSMYQMTATGQCGVDCYIGAIGDQRYINTSRFDFAHAEYESVLFDSLPRQMRDITLNLPLYQGVSELHVGIEPSSEIAAFPGFPVGKKVLLYGTSITHGACATRPGMAYPNILSRMFPLEFLNLGFSGNAQGEPELAHIISQIEEPGLLILDYEANTPSTERLRESLPEFIRIYRQRHPEVPILVISQIRLAREVFDEEQASRREERKRIQREEVGRQRSAGDRNVHFFDGALLLGDDPQDCTTDGIHPSDLGYDRIAKTLRPVIADLLKAIIEQAMGRDEGK
ncbi:SGNH/GDSL hydrolase family protein [Cohnella lupini]|uniref:Lysophospholipase L1-like esterase n=1 Tax=Cohnella lupini TaxID=1294267 RepID=A0A3D9HY27_9BACL|nr:SGNH/GDSL hydrolase family protein [Cohnella lupini]RED54408.1 lysophospholipase L1-like esterase [Cohnella lupini]